MEIAALGAVYPRNFRKRVAQMRGHRPRLQLSADEFQQSIEFQNPDRNAKVKDMAGPDATQPDGVLFGSDLNFAGQRLHVSIRITMVIGESNSPCQRNPQAFK